MKVIKDILIMMLLCSGISFFVLGISHIAADIIEDNIKLHKEAFEEGKLAAEAGIDPNNNPYPHPYRKDWLQGYVLSK